jgi:ADP-ribose pyrophosphatase
MDLNETVIASERIYDGRIVNVRVDTVTLPNGKNGRREIVEHGEAVAIVPIRDDGLVLMVRQFRLAAGGPLLEIPAGGMEKGESPEVCARRELSEEIGMTPDTLIPLYAAFVAPGYTTEKIYGFLARGLKDDRKPGDEDEFVEIVPMTLEEAIAAIASGEIQDMKTIAGLTMAARVLIAER